MVKAAQMRQEQRAREQERTQQQELAGRDKLLAARRFIDLSAAPPLHRLRLSDIRNYLPITIFNYFFVVHIESDGNRTDF